MRGLRSPSFSMRAPAVPISRTAAPSPRSAQGENGYAAELDARGEKRLIETRFIVNATGPFVAGVDAVTDKAPPARALTLVRGAPSFYRCRRPHKPTPIPSGRRGACRFRPALARPALLDRRHGGRAA